MNNAGDAGSGPSSQNNTTFSRWSPSLNSLFIELLDEEVQKINYVATLPYKEGKKNIIRKFHEKSGYKIDWEKCKNKHDDFRSLYAVYQRLVRRTGTNIDRETGKITMDASWWEDRKKDTEGATRLKKNPLPCMDLMHKVYGPHCVVNDNMMSASQIYDLVESENDEEEQEFVEEDDDNEEDETYGIPDSEQHQPMGNQQSVPIEIPMHNRRSRQRGSRGGRTIGRGRNQSSRQTTQPPRRRAVMDTHLTNIESYLATMQTPIQMLNARSQANQDYERESWLQLNALQNIEKFTDFWWASSEILRDPFEQKRFVLLKDSEERIRFLEGVTGYDRSGTFRGSPWKRQLSGSSGPSSRGSFGSGSGSPGVGGFSQFSNAGFSNIGGTSNFGGDGTSNFGGFSNFGGSGSPNQFRRRQGFQVPNSNPQFDESSNPRVVSGEGFAYRPAPASELLERFNLSDFNRTFGNNDNNGDN